MLFLLFSTLFYFAVQSSDVISATEKTFHKLLDSKLPVLVKFYAPWCGHCKSLAPTWEKVATSLKGLANIVKVDCTVEQSLCGKYSIQGYPTLKLFKNKGKKVQDYQQARDLAAIVRFTQGEIDDKSLKIKNDADLTKFLEKDAALPHVILFSEKAAPAPLFKALSCSFDGSLVFGLASSKAQSVVEKYGPIEKFPHILVATADGVKRYTGEIAIGALSSFLSEFAPPTETPASSSPETAKPAPKAATPPKPVAAWKDATQEANLDETCRSSLCVVALVEYDSATNAPLAAHQEILDEALAKFSKGSKFTFFVAPVTNADLSAKFKLSEPSLFFYNAKKQKIAKAVAFESASVLLLLERAIGGDFSYVPL